MPDETPTKPGWVYILTNPHMPGLVKVGMTTRTPTDRLAELTAASGVPAPFKLEWCRAVSNCAAVERSVHRMLDDRRVSGRREFFRCDVATARQVVEASAGALLGRRYRVTASRPRKGRQWGRGRRGRPDYVPALLTASAIALVAMLVVFRPALPSWLPVSVAQGFQAVENLRG
jgi:hypothetical protein